MDSAKLDENPREKASVFSVLSFYWTFGLFRKGYSKVLQLDDLIRPLTEDRSERLGDLLNRQVYFCLSRGSCSVRMIEKRHNQKSFECTYFLIICAKVSTVCLFVCFRLVGEFRSLRRKSVVTSYVERLLLKSLKCLRRMCYRLWVNRMSIHARKFTEEAKMYALQIDIRHCVQYTDIRVSTDTHNEHCSKIISTAHWSEWLELCTLCLITQIQYIHALWSVSPVCCTETDNSEYYNSAS